VAMASLAKAFRPLVRTATRPSARALRPASSRPSPLYVVTKLSPWTEELTRFRMRCFATTSPLSSTDMSDIPPTPITHLSDTEALMAESVSKFASEVILPRARDMDEAEAMDPTVVEHLFEQGLMGIEIPEEYGGSGMNFTAAIIAIEELARVDPSVSVMCDVHNTLCNTAILKYASESLKKEWLPKLATDTVGMPPSLSCFLDLALKLLTTM
jgi:short-chain 2-methylacyl-CoA dehydrogenase